MKATILIVEDEDVLRAMLQLAFEKSGFTVLAAGSIGEALALAATHSFDAVLTDFQLPDHDGLHLCRVLREQSQTAGERIPIWMMTGSHHVTEAQANAAGVEAVLRKPFKAPEVCEHIARFLHARPSKL